MLEKCVCVGVCVGGGFMRKVGWNCMQVSEQILFGGVCVGRWFARFLFEQMCVYADVKCVSAFNYVYALTEFLECCELFTTNWCQVHWNLWSVCKCCFTTWNARTHTHTHSVLKTGGWLNVPAAWGDRDSRVLALHWICFCQHVRKVVSY